MLKKALKKLGRMVKTLFFGVFWYTRDLFKYKRLIRAAGENISFKYFPQIFDRDPSSHTFDKHYVYMDAWAFKQLLNNRPKEHVDVGSSIRFLSMATTVVPVKFVDIRPIKLDFENFECIPGSILNLPFESSSVSSISCLHVAEHIGLGRYGGPLDPLGTIKACAELERVLSPGGKLYFALPVGRPAVYFNAHRVHDPLEILGYFKNLKLLSFAAVGDDGHFYPQADLKDYTQANYACGMFEFTR